MNGKTDCPYLNPVHEDAKLTQRGRLQATAVGPKLARTKPCPEVILVSPLSRTLQTAVIGLSTIRHLDIPMIAEENVRERIGLHVCDKRSDVKNIQKMFQKVDFSNIKEGPDVEYPSDVRETEEKTAERGKEFFLSLKDRKEDSFAVVTHSSFLYNTINKSFEIPNPKGKFVSFSFSSSNPLRIILSIYFPCAYVFSFSCTSPFSLYSSSTFFERNSWP